jgi:hypothetical protein
MEETMKKYVANTDVFISNGNIKNITCGKEYSAEKEGDFYILYDNLGEIQTFTEKEFGLMFNLDENVTEYDVLLEKYKKISRRLLHLEKKYLEEIVYRGV